MKRNHLKKLMVLLVFVYANTAFAQQATVTGTVSDAEGPLPGVNIIEKGTTNGVTTDFDGNYTITVPSDATLIFSYIGYKPQEILVNGKNTINIILEQDSALLDEVVVVGFGSQAKVDVTGAISQIKQREIKQIVNADPTNALQGRLAGVQIESSGGEPAAGTNVIVRGISSLTNTFPLYVVDGTVVDDITFLNPKDIIDIQVLKDATSAAIYGTRAANGVIIVSTNRGSVNSAPKVSVDIRSGVNTVGNSLDLLNGPEFVAFLNQRSANEGLPGNITDPGVDTDFQDLTLNLGVVQDYGFNISGGGEGSSYFFSANYYDEEAIVISSDFQRINVRLNSRFNFGKFTIEESFSYNQRDFTQNPFFGNNTFTAPVVRATAPERLGGFEAIDSNLFDGSGGTNNYALAQLTNDQTTQRNVLGNINLKYNIAEGLTVGINYGVDYRNNYGNFFRPTFDLSPTDQEVNINEANDLTEVRGEIISTNIEPTINYKKTFGKHDIDILLGGARQQIDNNSLAVQVEGLPSNNITNIAGFADLVLNTGGGRFLSRLFSAFGRVNYKFDDKYLFTGIIRRDATSRFSSENGLNTGVFPSFSAGWIMSNEDWWPEEGVVNTLKLRGGYGELGSQNIGDFVFQSVLNPSSNVSFNNVTAGGFAITSLVDENITFETARSLSFGADASLFDNRLAVSADYFVRNNDDVLAAVSVPSTTGSATPVIQNAASIRNKGFELQANYNHNSSGDFDFNIGFTFATINNELTDLPNPLVGPSIDEEGNTPNRFEVGQPLGFFFGFRNDGIYKSQAEIDSDPGVANDPERRAILQPGDFRRIDLDGNGIIDNDDRTNIGDPIPDFTYGLTFNGAYKNWDFGLAFNGVQGNEIFNATRFTGTFFLDGNKFGYLRDAFVLGQNEDTNIPRASLPNDVGNQLPSDFYVEDGSYLRLRSIEIGYDLTKVINIPWVSNARLFYNMQNVFTITGYSGYDPEVGSTPSGTGGGFFGAPVNTPPIFGRGVDLRAQPRPRTFILGIQASF
ncbi:SusC/RagA family TonB-linked outer membrane protein [Costertonia aggregata]|uniref:TonB-dependent receptor n=1 Tax=Costertonia aggregata TaxID=343403 RepID=A0A7H9ALX1_9FLAO|nr:TonB-dependent receptor [Costertonia aggregata]QLG44373.1 TonB-dependent receptor [Costertonia aggregata]